MSISADPLPESAAPHASEGSIVANAYVKRSVVVYAIHEPEAESLSMLTSLSTLFFSLGCLAMSLPVGVWLNNLFSTVVTEDAHKAINLIFNIGLGVSIIFFTLAVLVTYKRSNAWKKIKSQSTLRA